MHTLFLWLRTLLNLELAGGFNMGLLSNHISNFLRFPAVAQKRISSRVVVRSLPLLSSHSMNKPTPFLYSLEAAFQK